MINLKEHFRLSAIYTFFAAFPAVLQLIVYPLIEGEERLGPVDFGYLAITEAIVSVVFIVCTFGMVTGIARFYYDHKESRENYNKLVSTVLSGIIGRGMMMMGIAVVFAPFIGSLFSQPALQNFIEYGPSLIIAGFSRSVLVTLLALYRNEKRLMIFITVSLLSGLLKAGFQLTGVLFLDMSFLGYVHGTAAGSLLVALGVIAWSYYNCGLHYDRSIRRSLSSFVTPLFFSDIILWGLLFADRFFLLNKPGELGIYDNAMKFAIGVQLIIQGLSNAVQPEIYRYLKDGAVKRSAELKSLANLFIAEATGIIIIAVIPVMLFITTFYETDLRLSSGLVTIVFVRFILTAQYKIFALPLMFAKKTRIFFFVNSAVLVLNLAINWFLTPVIGYYGAITAFITAYFFQVILVSVLQHRIVPITWNSMKILYLPLAIVILAILLEMAKLFLDANPFLTAAIFVSFSLCMLGMLYRREIRAQLGKLAGS